VDGNFPFLDLSVLPPSIKTLLSSSPFYSPF
jgi:hypothetical protein